MAIRTGTRDTKIQDDEVVVVDVLRGPDLVYGGPRNIYKYLKKSKIRYFKPIRLL